MLFYLVAAILFAGYAECVTYTDAGGCLSTYYDYFNKWSYTTAYWQDYFAEKYFINQWSNYIALDEGEIYCFLHQLSYCSDDTFYWNTWYSSYSECGDEETGEDVETVTWCEEGQYFEWTSTCGCTYRNYVWPLNEDTFLAYTCEDNDESCDTSPNLAIYRGYESYYHPCNRYHYEIGYLYFLFFDKYPTYIAPEYYCAPDFYTYEYSEHYTWVELFFKYIHIHKYYPVVKVIEDEEVEVIIVDNSSSCECSE